MAIQGVKDPTVILVNSETTLLDNLAAAEVRLRSDNEGKKKAIAVRLADARARAGASSHARKSAGASANLASNSTGLPQSSAYGQYREGSLGSNALSRVKETQMLLHHFDSLTTRIRLS